MELKPRDFTDFFRELYGHEPFQWQQELLELVAGTGRWPDTISAPTGSGKTSVIDVHAFVNALAHQEGGLVPRRLVMTVNRRSLIDDHAEHAARLAARLDGASGEGPDRRPVTERVAALLRARSGPAAGESRNPALAVHTVRGGQRLSRDWTGTPLACAVICMTPDMWGSRILFRGYGSSVRSRPMEAGLLGRDAVLIVDEAHLNRQLLLTARRVAQLEQAATHDLNVPVLQVVETTATPASDSAGHGTAVGVHSGSLGMGSAGKILRQRLMTPKPVIVRELPVPRKRQEELADAFVAECRKLAEDPRFSRAPIGCIVNTVALARETAARLRAATEDPEAVLEVVGGLRPYDRRALTRLHPRLRGRSAEERTDPAAAVRFVVGTQALEVGIDIDLAALVTELAPAAAIVQRSGRVNRYGESGDALVVVLAPEYDTDSPGVPYDPADLAAATDWLTARAKTDTGLAPAGLVHDQPPAAAPRRVLYQRLEWHDIARLNRTSEETVFSDRDLPGSGEDLTLWLRDDFSEQAEAAVVIRAFMPHDAEHARRVADATSPLADEMFSVSLHRVRLVAEALLKPATRGGYLVAYRRNQATVLKSAQELAPGDVLIVPPGTQVLGQPESRQAKASPVDVTDVFDESVKNVQSALQAAEYGPPFRQVRVLIPGRESGADAEESRSGGMEDSVNPLILGAGAPEAAALFEDPLALALSIRELGNRVSRIGADASSRGHESTPGVDVGRIAAELLLIAGETEAGDAEPEIEVIPGLSEEDPVFILVRNRPVYSEEGWSEFARANVRFEDHAEAVETRAREYVLGLRLPADVAGAVTLAARHHDDGKLHPRFQAYLAWRWPQPHALAKSKYMVTRKHRAELGLVGWRHEQLSAAMVAAAPGSDDAARRSPLVTWLAGTSHGNGRGSFPHAAAQLLLNDDHGLETPVVTAASALFDEGEWEALFEDLPWTYGFWGLAYLEALLRAADQTVSGEGK